ncbi:cupin domain-containing protein, partial [Clostridium perfringens]|nr:cupin domain-containing protein [Clostridium perfringens]
SSHVPMPWHYHKEIEFILVEHGIHEMETPERSYTLEPGDIVVLGSSQLHRPRKISDDPLSFIVLHVDLEPYFDPAIMMYYGHFAEVQEPLDELNYIFADEQVRSEVGRIITSIHDEVMSPRKGYEIAVSMHIQHLMLTLLRQDTIGKLQSYGEIDAAVIRPVVAYVEEHLTDRIDMQEVCRIAGMSYTYFSK